MFADGSVYACELGEAGNGLITSTGDVSLLTGSTLVMQATSNLAVVGDAAETIILADERVMIDGTFTNRGIQLTPPATICCGQQAGGVCRRQ